MHVEQWNEFLSAFVCWRSSSYSNSASVWRTGKRLVELFPPSHHQGCVWICIRTMGSQWKLLLLLSSACFFLPVEREREREAGRCHGPVTQSQTFLFGANEMTKSWFHFTFTLLCSSSCVCALKSFCHVLCVFPWLVCLRLHSFLFQVFLDFFFLEFPDLLALWIWRLSLLLDLHPSLGLCLSVHGWSSLLVLAEEFPPTGWWHSG